QIVERLAIGRDIGAAPRSTEAVAHAEALVQQLAVEAADLRLGAVEITAERLRRLSGGFHAALVGGHVGFDACGEDEVVAQVSRTSVRIGNAAISIAWMSRQRLLSGSSMRRRRIVPSTAA